METRPMRVECARRARVERSANSEIDALAERDAQFALAYYTHTHLNSLNTKSVVSILNHPSAETFNETLRHKLIDGLKQIKPVSSERSQRDDAYWAGRMTNRHVPGVSRRPPNLRMGVLTHIVSDIGVVPVKDRHGNVFFVLYKCLYTQFRVVHRLRKKEHIVDSWRKFITDFALQDKIGSIKVRVKYLVTDDDQSYVAGKVKELNNSEMIGQWTIAPYTHNANPAESEMRRIMESAVCALYSSGLPPSFLLDALEHGCAVNNMLYTSVHYEEDHKYKSPWERVKGSKPHINNIARFGSKTYVFINKDERVKGDSHQWIGWYLGVSDNMLASRVYRPITHTVYDRFHTLHDSSVVYGDFLGNMYKKRVESDRAQRRYFNAAVDELLGTPENARDEVLRVMRARVRGPNNLTRTSTRREREMARAPGKRTRMRTSTRTHTRTIVRTNARERTVQASRTSCTRATHARRGSASRKPQSACSRTRRSRERISRARVVGNARV